MMFFELIQIALGNRDIFSHNPTKEEWLELFTLCKKQAVAGVAFEALEKLSKQGQKPPTNTLFEWIGISEQIKQRNLLLNKRCEDLTILFANAGFGSCILKGQGNARMYTNPLSRTPGDIDIWINGKKEVISSFVKEKFPNADECIYHIDYPVFDDVEVEVHYTPSYWGSPKYQKSLFEYFHKHAEEQFKNVVSLHGSKGNIFVPTNAFNIVYQMVHVFSHFINYGVGLRQIIDYYYLLIRSFESEKNKDYGALFNHLGLSKFSGALMWVLQNGLGLGEQYLLVEPDKKRGKLLLDEIIICGNMGAHDKRASGKLRKKYPYVSKFIRNQKLGLYFPYEVWTSPLLRKIHRGFTS